MAAGITTVDCVIRTAACRVEKLLETFLASSSPGMTLTAMQTGLHGAASFPSPACATCTITTLELQFFLCQVSLSLVRICFIVRVPRVRFISRAEQQRNASMCGALLLCSPPARPGCRRLRRLTAPRASLPPLWPPSPPAAAATPAAMGSHTAPLRQRVQQRRQRWVGVQLQLLWRQPPTQTSDRRSPLPPRCPPISYPTLLSARGCGLQTNATRVEEGRGEKGGGVAAWRMCGAWR